MSMNKRRIWAVVNKEWAEIARNKSIILMMALIPFILVALIIGTDYGLIRSAAAGQDLSAIKMTIPGALAHLPRVEAFTIAMNEQFFFYLLLTPMTLPVYIAAHSIIGEKETHTLEPLLATPVSTGELLLGKGFAAAAPAVIVNWIAFAIILGGLAAIAPPVVLRYAMREVWIIGMLLFSPLLALFSVLLGMVISSRVNDPRAAQQITGVFVVPIIMISMMVMMGKVFLSTWLILGAAVLTFIVDMLVLYFAVKVFQRETILTRWK